MRGRTRTRFFGLLALSLVVAGAVGCDRGRSESTTKPHSARPAPREREPGFAGSAACDQCHASQFAEWNRSHHRQAMRELDGPAEVGDRNAAALAALDRAPREFHQIGYEPLRQILVDTGNGRLQVLPYAQESNARHAAAGDWFAVEAQASGAWLTDRFNANRLCIECHTTGYRKNYDPENFAYASRWEEPGVGCEACHGPSAEHARSEGVVATGASLRARGAWIFDEGAPTARREPALAPSPVVEKCALCHSLRDPFVVTLRANAGLFEQVLPAVVDTNNYEADGQIKEESYEYGAFLQSKMYAAGVGCDDCHLPHGLELRAEGNALCANCHRPDVFDTPAHTRHAAGTAGSRCVDCHMPERVFMQLDGRRDHGFKVPRPDLTLRFGVPNACGTCHAERGAEWAASTLDAAAQHGDVRAALAAALLAGERRSPGAGRLLAALAVDASASDIVRASAAAGLARLGRPVDEEVAGAAMVDPSPLVRAHAARLLPLAPPAEQPRLARRLDSDASAAVRHAAALPLAQSAAALGRTSENAARSLRAYIASLRPNFDDPAANVNAALAHVFLGEAGPAERRYRHALELRPGDAAAAVNLADLLRMTGRDREALELLASASRRSPDNAAVQYAYGLALQRAGRSAEALAAVQSAARLAPGHADYPYAYALALHAAGRTQEALAELQANRSRHPGHRGSAVAEASILRDAGDGPGARRVAREMLERDPDDAFAARLLAELDGSPANRGRP